MANTIADLQKKLGKQRRVNASRDQNGTAKVTIQSLDDAGQTLSEVTFTVNGDMSKAVTMAEMCLVYVKEWAAEDAD